MQSQETNIAVLASVWLQRVVSFFVSLVLLFALSWVVITGATLRTTTVPSFDTRLPAAFQDPLPTERSTEEPATRFVSEPVELLGFELANNDYSRILIIDLVIIAGWFVGFQVLRRTLKLAARVSTGPYGPSSSTDLRAATLWLVCGVLAALAIMVIAAIVFATMLQ